MRATAQLALVGAVLSLLGATVAGAGGGGPEETGPEIACKVVPASHALLVNYGTPGATGQSPMLFLSRVGERIRLSDQFGPGSNVRCEGGRPTVRNIDRIELAAITEVRLTETYIDFSDGLFAPGATPEPGGDEIEINTSLGPNADISLFGTVGDDDWVLGSRRKERYFANFNPEERRPDRDLDIAFAFAPRGLSASLGPGDDRITAKGGAGTGGPLSIGVDLVGLEGDDRLIGGPRDDFLLGYEGNDLLAGGHGDDKLDTVGGRGSDTLICGPGRDEWRNSSRDEVRC